MCQGNTERVGLAPSSMGDRTQTPACLAFLFPTTLQYVQRGRACTHAHVYTRDGWREFHQVGRLQSGIDAAQENTHRQSSPHRDTGLTELATSAAVETNEAASVEATAKR